MFCFLVILLVLLSGSHNEDLPESSLTESCRALLLQNKLLKHALLVDSFVELEPSKQMAQPSPASSSTSPQSTSVATPSLSGETWSTVLVSEVSVQDVHVSTSGIVTIDNVGLKITAITPTKTTVTNYFTTSTLVQPEADPPEPDLNHDDGLLSAVQKRRRRRSQGKFPPQFHAAPSMESFIIQGSFSTTNPLNLQTSLLKTIPTVTVTVTQTIHSPCTN